LNREIANEIKRKKRTKPFDLDSRTILDLALRDEEYGAEATMQELVDEIKGFLFVGHDTSAAMMSWAYYYLATYPDFHAKMRAEHDSIFGPFVDVPSLVAQINENPKLLARLEYTLAFLKEVLRLRPPADGARQGPAGYVIRTSSGLEFDASDTMISAQHLGLHTNESSWGPSAADFNPERFTEGKSIPPCFIPFSTRPRDCIGRNLAFLEVRSRFVLF